MNVIDHVTAQLELGREWEHIAELAGEYRAVGNDPAVVDIYDRPTLAAEIADTYERCAVLLDSSGLVRWLSSSLTADDLRAKAAHWRLYGDPEADNR
jgi:hypothetical protein